MRAALLLVIACACGRSKESAPAPAPVPATGSAAMTVPQLVAHTLCDWYWRSSTSNARPYDSMEQCLTENTATEGACSEAQAKACAAYMKTAKPGEPPGLVGSEDCVACMEAVNKARFSEAFAKEQAALDAAKLVVHSATLHSGLWHEDIAERRTDNAVLVVVDVELSGFGYRIDPDDFLVVAASADAGTSLSDSPYAERLTRDGKPVEWDDPEYMAEPDLRMRAFFPTPRASIGTPLSIEYNGKRSPAFTLR